jgi:hypothetical protein
VLVLINKFYAWGNRLIPRSWPVKLFGLLIKRAMTKKAVLVIMLRLKLDNIDKKK